jgi:hypothetical protein
LPTFVVVKTGELKMYDGKEANCPPEVLRAGNAFIDPPDHPHRYWNDGLLSAETLTARIYVPDTGKPERIDQPQAATCAR